jgi:hypothetical protein
MYVSVTEAFWLEGLYQYMKTRAQDDLTRVAFMEALDTASVLLLCLDELGRHFLDDRQTVSANGLRQATSCAG